MVTEHPTHESGDDAAKLAVGNDTTVREHLEAAFDIAERLLTEAVTNDTITLRAHLLVALEDLDA